jgi:hypothetical protein
MRAAAALARFACVVPPFTTAIRGGFQPFAGRQCRFDIGYRCQCDIEARERGDVVMRIGVDTTAGTHPLIAAVRGGAT